MKLLISILLITYCSTTFAQSNAHKSSIFIGLGPSVTIGDFGNKESRDQNAGLAATGFYIDLGYQNQFSKIVGALVMLKGKSHTIANQYLRYYIPDNSGGSLGLKSNNWKMGSVLAGLTQKFALSKNEVFSIEFREAAGVQFTSSPEIELLGSLSELAPEFVKQESQLVSSFAYLVGLGFKYQLNRSLGLKAYGDFNSSNAKFKEYTVKNGNNTFTVPPSEQQIQTIDYGLSFIIGF